MKLLIVGDQHRTDKCPKNRTDDYYKTILRKTEWEFDCALQNDCEYIIFPGDVFDTYKTPFNVVRDMIELTRRYEDGIFNLSCLYTFGQHDVRYHTTDVTNTPLGVLLAGTRGKLVGSRPTIINENIHVYGAGWGEETPEPVDTSACNILVTHRTVIKDDLLWPGQTGYYTAADLLKDGRYTVWACGDNHQRVTMSNVHHRHVVNMGSMMRSTIAQFDHKPAVCVFDTTSRDVRYIDIPLVAPDKVFRADEIVEATESDARIAEFVEQLQNVDTSVTDFPQALALYMQQNHLPDDVVSVLHKITNMEQYHG